MSHRRYERYKDVHVPGVDAVPSHWSLARLKHVATVQTGIAKGKDNTGVETVTVPYLRVANVQDGYFALDDVATIEVPVADVERYLLRAGDVLMNEGGDNDKLGRGHVWTGEVEPCVHQNHVFAVRPHRVAPSWLNTVTGSSYAQFFFLGRAKQSTNLASISSTNLMELPVVLPPDDEQEAIAAFLDRETAKIHALIAEQERLIALLAEKRQAVISHAVTKGLDPTVEMKDSGVEWLGEVPAHWAVEPIKRYYDTASGGTPNTNDPDAYYTDATGVPWVRTTDLNDSVVGLEQIEVFLTERGLRETACKVLPVGTVIVAMYGGDGTIGKSGVLGIEAALNQALCGLIPGGRGLKPRLLYWYMQFYRPYWMIGAASSRKDPNISQGLIRNAPVLVPPEDEQDAIIAHLDGQASRFDELASEADCAVALLQERRTALISAAVTGQIDVREHAVVLA